MLDDSDVVDFSAGLLVRYFRNGQIADSPVPRLDARRDLEILKGHWAISEPVHALVRYVLAHPQEVQRLLRFEVRVDDAVARGRIDARATWLYRQQSGLSFAVVTHEPVRSFETGPNLLVAWVLKEASLHAGRLSDWQVSGSPYAANLESTLDNLRKVQRIEALRDLKARERPNGNIRKVARRSRQKIYQLAAHAYEIFVGLERGSSSAIATVVQSTLLAPLENWRRFELAVGLAASEALAARLGVSLHLRILSGKFNGPIAEIGAYRVFWQQQTSYFSVPPLEPSEQVVKQVLTGYGIAIGSDRPDFVIVDSANDRVAAIIEVKLVSGDSVESRFKEAIQQVVRYARGYGEAGALGRIGRASLVAISHNAPQSDVLTLETIQSIDFERIKRLELTSWADQLVSQPH
jgi:hypothetical protein